MKGFYVSKRNNSEARTHTVPSEKTPATTEEISVIQQAIEIEQQEFPITSMDRSYVESKRSKKSLEEDCGDILTLRNGDELKVKVIELTTTEIKYKRCDNVEGPMHAISKNEVFSIKYANGAKEVISPSVNASDQKTIHWATITGLGCSFITILLLFVSGLVPVLITGALSLAFSLIGLRALKKYPEKYKGNNLALASVILSGIILALVLLSPFVFRR